MELKQIAKQNLPNTRKEWIWFIIIMLVVIGISIVIFNQFLEIRYKAILIQAPCQLCKEFRSQGALDISNLSNMTLQFVQK